MKPIKLTDAQMDAALGIANESTGNRKCWHVIDTRDMIVEHERLTLRQARQMSHLPHRTYCRDGFKIVQCDGEAHDNPHIDHCMQCAPRWGWVMVPRELTHVEKTLLGALK